MLDTVSTQEEPLSPMPHLAVAPPDDGDNGLSQRVESLRLDDNVVSGNSGGGRLSWILCLLLAGSTAALGYLLYQERNKADRPAENVEQAENDGQSKPPPVPGESEETLLSGSIVLEAKGHIIPAHQILVSPKVGGMVVKMRIIESQKVVKGEILAELEDTEYRADRDRAKAILEASKHQLAELERGFRPAEIEQAKAELAESQVQLVQLEADFKRATELLEKRVLSQEQYDLALSKYKVMGRRVRRLELALDLAEEGPRIERINVAKAQVQQFEAELTKAQWRLDNCIIRAPISGTILKKNAEEGNLVNPIAMQGNFSLCEMADLSDIEVELNILEREISKIFKGQKCKVRSDAYPDIVYEGYVSRQMPTAERGKAAIPIRVKVTVPANEEGKYLKPDMGALVSFLNEKQDAEIK